MIWRTSDSPETMLTSGSTHMAPSISNWPDLTLLEQPLPELGIVLLEEVEEHRLVIHEDELGILLHQVEHRGKAAPGLVAGMHDAPEPADIEMGGARPR